MNKATHKLASGVRKVKERQAAPAAAETTAVRRPAQHKAERAANPRGLAGGAFEHPPRVWPD